LIFWGLHHWGVALFEYDGKEEGKFKATIFSDAEKKQYTTAYQVLMDGQKFICYIKNKDTDRIEIGDIIEFEGKYNKPDSARNEGGFDYNLYLKSKNIKRIFSIDTYKVIEKNERLNVSLARFFSDVRNKIKECFEQNLSKENAALLSGLTIGDKSNLDKEVIEKYRNASLSHVLAISGAHFSYIILCLKLLDKKLRRKRLGQAITLIGILFFIELTNATPSVIRAGIMAIMPVVASMMHRKNDFWTTLCFSILVQFINNPYVIFDIGFQLSYGGVIGIVCFYERIKRMIKLRIISVCLSANVIIIPIMMYLFQTISFSFIFSNFLATILLGPIVILGFLSVIFRLKIIFWILNLFLFLFQKNAEICASIPFAKLYIIRPTLISMAIYYLAIFSKLNIKKIIASLILTTIVFNLNYECMFADLKDEMLLNFVDVRQGDCCLIRYAGKNILIDSGGSDDNYDVGKNILLPYLLTKKITKIDYAFVSHMDSDHCKGLFYVAEHLRIENIIIGLQAEEYPNLKMIKEIANRRKIKIQMLQAGNIININIIKITVIWPIRELMITENEINNNSLVFRIDFKNNSFLFTGDIEKVAEEKILETYKYNLKVLDVDVLKVGHHGSKTSSIDNFIFATTPIIALIGVAKNNKYGHPASTTIEKLNKLKCKIYRTDKMGEIKLTFK
jgi:competence protein ComEC